MDVVGKFENAKKIMDECENSQLVLERKKEHIKMAPKFLGNFRVGIQQHLTEKLLHWDKVSDGFPLAYTNVHALQKFGKIISDHTCVHFDVEADYIIFKPVVGQKLNGKVNKIAKRHIGCLVHDNFNAWVLHTSRTEKMAADSLMGAEIEISVQDISTSRNVVSIRGKFERFLTPLIENEDIININSIPNKRRQRKKKDVEEVAEVDNTITEQNSEIEVNDSVISKKKKKHKKETEISEDSQNDSHVIVNGDLEEESPSKTKKKHKKEKKKKKNQKDESLANGAENVDNSLASLIFSEPLFTSTQIEEVNNDSGIKKSKKHKKKHKEITNDTNNREADLDTLVVNGSPLAAAECSGNDGMGNSAGDSLHKQKKAKKRTHKESNFTSLKDSAVNHDSELSGPSQVKKLKTLTKALDVDFNSSADFEDTSAIKRKEKKKKKHKDKS